jgi:ABC-type Mn2+/Zn2+ transport system permease subunit
MCVLAVLIGFASCIAGLLLSYHASLPSGPASTYIDMMHNNITQIKGAILGS